MTADLVPVEPGSPATVAERLGVTDEYLLRAIKRLADNADDDALELKALELLARTTGLTAPDTSIDVGVALNVTINGITPERLI